MANESTPDNPLPVDFVPEGSVETHRVSDGEDWAAVAAKYNVKVSDLICITSINTTKMTANL
jgi:predicted nuclease with TOPRIM domain